MKTIEQIARELGDDWDATLPEDKVFIENVAKAYLSAWLEQQPQEPVAWASGHLRYAFERTERYIPLSVEVSLVNLGWKNQLPLFLAPPPAIPEGYVLVPKEPTEAMLEHVMGMQSQSCDTRRGHYKDMLAAAQGGKE